MPKETPRQRVQDKGRVVEPREAIHTRLLRVGGSWFRDHGSEIAVGLLTTVAGVWLAYDLTIKEDFRQIRQAQEEQARHERNQDEAIARSVLQEMRANHYFITENLRVLNAEVISLKKRLYGIDPLIELYDATGPSIYRNMPSAFLNPDSVRVRTMSILVGTYTVNSRIRFRERFMTSQLTAQMDDGPWANFASSLDKIDRTLIRELEGLEAAIVWPDTIWKMSTAPPRPGDNLP